MEPAAERIEYDRNGSKNACPKPKLDNVRIFAQN